MNSCTVSLPEGARHAVPVRSRANPSLHKSHPSVNLTPVDATLTTNLATIENKGLSQKLSPLDATLTKSAGGV